MLGKILLKFTVEVVKVNLELKKEIKELLGGLIKKMGFIEKILSSVVFLLGGYYFFIENSYIFSFALFLMAIYIKLWDIKGYEVTD